MVPGSRSLLCSQVLAGKAEAKKLILDEMYATTPTPKQRRALGRLLRGTPSLMVRAVISLCCVWHAL